jgi:hypothetical protein
MVSIGPIWARICHLEVCLQGISDSIITGPVFRLAVQAVPAWGSSGALGRVVGALAGQALALKSRKPARLTFKGGKKVGEFRGK